MTARARLTTTRAHSDDGTPVSRVARLRTEGPLALRPVGARGPEPLVRADARVARVALASGAAGPLGGDDFSLEVRVGEGSTLVLSEVSSTLLLPGPHGGRSRMRIAITVESGATFSWRPEPLIAVRGCHHVHEIDVDLAPDARMIMRDEVVLGRYGEESGRLSQRVRIRRDGHSIYQQRLDLGPGAPGWRSPAVVGGYTCLGNVLAVGPDESVTGRVAQLIGDTAALLPLRRSGLVINALADDTVGLRRLLEDGTDLLGEPWSPPRLPKQGLNAESHPVMTRLAGHPDLVER